MSYASCSSSKYSEDFRIALSKCISELDEENFRKFCFCYKVPERLRNDRERAEVLCYLTDQGKLQDLSLLVETLKTGLQRDDLAKEFQELKERYSNSEEDSPPEETDSPIRIKERGGHLEKRENRKGRFFDEYNPVQFRQFWEFAHTKKVREDYGNKTIDSLFKDFEKYCQLSELNTSLRRSYNIDARHAVPHDRFAARTVSNASQARSSGYYSQRNSIESQALEDTELYHTCDEDSPVSTMSRASTFERNCPSSLVCYNRAVSEENSASNYESAFSSSEDETTTCQQQVLAITACSTAQPDSTRASCEQEDMLEDLQCPAKGLAIIKQLTEGEDTSEQVDIVTTTPVFIPTTSVPTPATNTTGYMRLHASDITQALAAKDPKILFKSQEQFSMGENYKFEMRFCPTNYQKNGAALHIHLVPPSSESDLASSTSGAPTTAPQEDINMPSLSIMAVLYDCQTTDGDLDITPDDARIVTYEQISVNARCLKDCSMPVASFPHILKHEMFKTLTGNIIAIHASLELKDNTQ